MIKKKEQLFQLIKSLNKEEKRHFKLYVNKYSSTRENNYLKLFNAIDKQELYDEDAIKQQFKGDLFVKQLTVTKHYLQKQIIRSLQNLHYDDSVDLSMLALHHQIAVLYKKGHYEICRELVKKGIEVCAVNELFLEWIGFLKWELNLLNMMDLADYKASLSKYLEKTSQLLSWYEITTQGDHLTNQIQIFSLDTSTFGSHSSHYQVLITKIESLISSIDMASLPLKTRFNLLFPLAQSYLSIADYSHAFDQFMNIYEELKNEYISKDLHERFINTLVGLIYSGGAVDKPEVVKMAMEDLKIVPEINPHISFRKAESLAFYPLINCALGGDFYNGLTSIEIIESFLEKYSDKATSAQHIYAYYYSAYIYFGNSIFPLALKYLRKIDSYQNKDLLPNLRLAVKMMEIIIFFEQQKFDLVESRLKSLQRQLQKEENVKSFIRKFISYFQRLIVQDPDSQMIQDQYKRFLKEMINLHFSEQVSMFIYFDLISWLESKIDGSTFGEKLQVNSSRLFKSSMHEA